MAVMIKCKMCGGDLQLTEGSTIATCEYCGTQQTVPTQDNEKKLVQFERADRLRRSCEFDKAAGVYESIVADFRQEAEAYWGLVLCKYGIEYVDDPASGKKIPTCHRSSFDSVMDDPNFEQTLENADAVSRKVYREEAKQIEEIRKGIVEVSAKEDPYDIFICYKETAEDGQRTVDSVLAQDIYSALTEKGYRVFFSRITLEDKLGQEYEPYIFAALNSAKVMLAIGTDYEHYNAVWVKNEWSRYLKLMEADKNKHLIPCFKGIDAYDMPKEFNKLQAQDLGKVGAVQDLLRGIDKLIAVKPASVQPAAGVQSDDVNRIYIYNSAMENMKSKKVKKAKDAVKKLESLGEWGDAPQQLESAKKHLKKRKAARTVRRIITWLIILGIIGGIGAVILGQFKGYYDDGVKYMEQGKYARAAAKFDSATFYKDAQQKMDDAKDKAGIADKELRNLLPNDSTRFFFGDAWLSDVLENGNIKEGDVLIDSGNSYNNHMESLHMELIFQGNGGEVTYVAERDEFLFTPNSGASQVIRIENGDLIMEDGTVYYNAGVAMQKISEKIASCIEDKDYEKASEMMAITAEIVASGLLQADSSFFSAVPALAENAETMIKKKQDMGADMLLALHEGIMQVCSSGNVIDSQAVYEAASAMVDVCERLAKKQLAPSFEILTMSMDFYLVMAQSGELGEDPALIDQFVALAARAEQLINEYY